MPVVCVRVPTAAFATINTKNTNTLRPCNVKCVEIMKIEYNIKKFRKEFNKNFPNFYLRIREDYDIAYFNGLKAFEIIKENNDIINIFFPINAYKCNPTNVKKNKRINEDLKALLLPMTSFFDFSMSKISFKKTGFYKESVARERLKQFKNHVISLIDIDVEAIIEKLNQINYTQEIQENNQTVINLEFNEIKDINDIIDIQYHFINDLKINEDNKKNERKEMKSICRDIKFDFSINDKLDKNNKIQIYDTSKLFDFKEVVEKSIKNYEKQTTINREKKYQHQFMLGAYNSKLNIYLFEEEYYIKEKGTEDTTSDENEKNGRIDSILFKMKNKVLTDVYLIELKVNADVIAKDNGVLTHLDDIKNLINKTNFENQNKEDFFYKLKKRINYRLSELYDYELLNNDFSLIDYTIHFYTIVAYTNPIKNNKESVLKYFDYFKTKEGVNHLIKIGDLDKKFNDKSIYNIIDGFKDRNKCKLKFIFDEYEWDEKTDVYNPNFKDVTDIYFEGINNE